LARRWVTLMMSKSRRIAATKPPTKYWMLSLMKSPASLGKDAACAWAGTTKPSEASVATDEILAKRESIGPEATSSCP
jgi:hypothetical protein